MKKMSSLTKRLIAWTGLFTIFLLALVEGLCFFVLPDQPPSWLTINIAPDLYPSILMAAVAVVVIFWMLLLWLVIRSICRKEPATLARPGGPRKIEKKEQDPAENEKRLHRDKKMFLHLMSVLQTEGRLLDFLNEDLDQYEDGQIGAAARGVHDRCKQVLAKYVMLQPLSRQEEGDQVTVSGGFDPGAYRLSGNITGDPPFKGKLVHKGWRADRLNIPEFAFSGDPQIIAPMEVTVE